MADVVSLPGNDHSQLPWNCRHIANGDVIRRLLDANVELQRPTPLLVTREELLFTPEEDEP